MDMMARELKRDPIEFRRLNILQEGRQHATGQVLDDAPIEKILDTVLDGMAWSRPFDRGSGHIRRGRGVAIAIKAVVAPTTSVAILNVAADGSVTLYCGTVDMGQGSDTAMAQIVGETLGVPAESVRVVKRDTDVTPYDMGTLGSRSLFHMGRAVCAAADDVRMKIAEMRKEVGEPDGSNTSLPDLFKKKFGMQAGNIIGSGTYRPEYVSPSPLTGQSSKVTPFWLIAGCGAEVSVDTGTGHVRIDKLVNVVDAGKAVNPQIVKSQISGGALMQLGFTMFEKVHLDAGQVTNASLADYKIPSFHDLPLTQDNIFIDNAQSDGPFGAKGVGESAMFCVSPAIANALDDAVGIRLTELPLTPESLFRALRAKEGRPLRDD
jgi:CO/xanthine dehydrogenase Mo-binding subunit